MANNGKYGEQAFAAAMSELGYKLEDVSGNPSYWDKDIDFIALSPTTGVKKTFEVKWDTYISKTGNLFLEIANPRSKQGAGWYRFCQADYLAYGDARNETFYMFPLAELRERVHTLPRNVLTTYDGAVGLLVNLS